MCAGLNESAWAAGDRGRRSAPPGPGFRRRLARPGPVGASSVPRSPYGEQAPRPRRRPADPAGERVGRPGVRAGDLDVPNDVERTLASLLDGTPQVFADPAHDGELCATDYPNDHDDRRPAGLSPSARRRCRRSNPGRPGPTRSRTGDGPRSARGNGQPAAARSGPRRGPAQQGNQWRRRIQPATDLGVRGHDSLPGSTNSSVGT